MSAHKKVMIADDDAGIVDAIEIMLQYEGYEVNSAMNGDIVSNVQNTAPDLLLLDIWMSGIDGRDICRQLKQQEATRQIPVIMISASKDIEKSALDSGADDFLAKPFEMDELLEKIGRHLLSRESS